MSVCLNKMTCEIEKDGAGSVCRHSALLLTLINLIMYASALADLLDCNQKPINLTTQIKCRPPKRKLCVHRAMIFFYRLPK